MDATISQPGQEIGVAAPRRERVAALLACHNRRDITLRCLAALFQQSLPECELQVFLIDDGSTDGTSEAVAEQFPQVRIGRGSGKLFWNRGMHMAFSMALAEDFDYYLWLNDDTILNEDALALEIDTARELRDRGIDAIVTGSTKDAVTGVFTYGGYARHGRWLPPLFLHQHPDPEVALPCVTMNGNCTLIPRAVAKVVGNIDPHYQHSFGDVDYGLRATAAGFAVYAVPGYIGTCSENNYDGSWTDKRLPLRRRWELMQSPKGSSWREWSHFSRQNLGPLWPLYAVSPYIRLVLTCLVRGKI